MGGWHPGRTSKLENRSPTENDLLGRLGAKTVKTCLCRRADRPPSSVLFPCELAADGVLADLWPVLTRLRPRFPLSQSHRAETKFCICVPDGGLQRYKKGESDFEFFQKPKTLSLFSRKFSQYQDLLRLDQTPADIRPYRGFRGIVSPARTPLRSAVLVRHIILRSLTPLPRSFVRRVIVDPSPTSSEGLWEGW